LSAFTLNFTLQDTLGATLAFCLFPLVIVFPGYVTGWALDLFDFRLRQPIVRLGIGLILSFAVSPIVIDLTLADSQRHLHSSS
jgi:ABC-type sulfate transport system permease subunit